MTDPKSTEQINSNTPQNQLQAPDEFETNEYNEEMWKKIVKPTAKSSSKKSKKRGQKNKAQSKVPLQRSNVALSIQDLEDLMYKLHIIPQYEVCTTKRKGTPYHVRVTAGRICGNGFGKSKKTAKREAAKDALDKYTKFRLYNPGQNSILPLVEESTEGITTSLFDIDYNVPLRRAVSPVEILRELLKQFHKTPTYDYLGLKGMYYVRVVADEVICFGRATSKKEARWNAAKEALESFIKLGVFTPNQQYLQSVLLAENQKKINFKGNSVGILEKLCSKHNLQPAVYDELPTKGPAHQRIFTWECTVGNLKKVASGLTKKRTKQICAHMMYHYLIDYFNIAKDNSD